VEDERLVVAGSVALVALIGELIHGFGEVLLNSSFLPASGSSVCCRVFIAPDSIDATEPNQQFFCFAAGFTEVTGV